jgi:hypothetical protein
MTRWSAGGRLTPIGRDGRQRGECVRLGVPRHALGLIGKHGRCLRDRTPFLQPTSGLVKLAGAGQRQAEAASSACPSSASVRARSSDLFGWTRSTKDFCPCAGLTSKVLCSLRREEFLCDFAGGNRIGHPADDRSRRWHRVQRALGGPHRLPRGRIEQAGFQGHDDASGMQGGQVSLPAPYFNIEGATFELATRSQVNRLLGAPGCLVAYGRNDGLRGHDLDAPPCELLPHLCRQDIRDSDAPRTVSVGMQK